MTKYRLDCYTEMECNGAQPVRVLWFNTEAEADQAGEKWVEEISGDPAVAWFYVTEE